MLLIHLLLVLIIPCGYVPAGAVRTSVQRCQRRMDIVFLVDTSYTMYPNEFPGELKFVQDVIGQFEVSPSNTRVAVVSYSQGVREEFGLDQYQSLDTVLKAVGNIQYTRGDRLESHKAIEYAHKLLLQQSRHGAVPVIIFITGGKTSYVQQTLEVADEVRTKDILLFSVGVGLSLAMEELGKIATQNTNQFVYSAESFNKSSTIVQSLGPEVCKATPSVTQTADTCMRPTDLVFAIYSPHTSARGSSRDENNFIEGLLNFFHQSPTTTHVSMVTSREDSHDAIMRARVYLLGNSREGAVHIIVYITNGRAIDSDKALKEAKKARAKGIMLFTIGVGSEVDANELGKLATGNNGRFVFTGTSYDDLNPHQQHIAKQICIATPTETQSSQICMRPTDLVFAMDSPFSSGRRPFQQPLKFADGLRTFFHESPSTTNVATISHKVERHDIIRQARTYLLQQPRVEAVRIIVYITNGRATDPEEALKEARKAWDKGILLFVIGVGNKVDVTELGQLATENSGQFVFQAPNYNVLNRLQDQIAEEICSAKPLVTQSDQTCMQPTEMVFVMHMPVSSGGQPYQQESNFVHGLLKYFHQSPFTTIAAVTTSTNGSHEIIRDARTYLLQRPRVEAARIIVYITNGRATDPEETLKEANEVRAKGILLFALGVGYDVGVTELGQLATENNEQFVFVASDFNDLNRRQRAIAEQICSASVVKPPVEDCHRRMDIVFLVDTSYSMLATEFPLELEFVQDMIGQFDVSPSATRVAVISYSTGYADIFSLDQYQSSELMIEAVGKIHFTNGRRVDSHDAIQHALDLLLRQPRNGALRVIILISAGMATDRQRTIQVADNVRTKGILLFCVGVGWFLNTEELGHIATQNSKRFVYSADNFDDLRAISKSLVPQICAIPGHDVQSLQCLRPSDVVILVDTSYDISHTDFLLQLKFVQDLITHFDVSPQKTRVAVVSYSQGYREEFSLDQYQSADTMMFAVENIVSTRGGYLDSHDAIQHALKLLIRQSRNDAAHVIIYITHGRATLKDKTLKIADKVRDKGILMFSVGVGREVDTEELKEIATEKTKEFAHSVYSFHDLSTLSQTLGPKVCAAEIPIIERVRCDGPAELVFLVDVSRSIYPLDFPFELEFVNEVIEMFDISTIRVAAVSYSRGVNEEFNLNQHRTVHALRTAVDEITFASGPTTDTHTAIQYARQIILRESSKDVTRIIIAIVEGRPTDGPSTVQEAEEARKEGIILFAVGVGNEVNRRELGKMAFQNTEDFVHTACTFDTLPDISKVVGQKACSVISDASTATNKQ
uniref:CREWS-B n=1 Tax=Colubraria reticulata TaxID=604273 RepID=A0AA96UTL0_9CAEN|nr:CREWS-B [Colubraria reticulata]